MVELLFFLSIFKDLFAFMFNKDEQVNMRNYKNVWISSQLAAF